MNNEPSVIHVDENDRIIGYVPKLEAHRKGILHRAVSVLVFNHKGEWLLQKRADHKYHSGGLWSNTCCSHPFPDENEKRAAERRLKEEMGISCDLKKVLTFTYKAVLDNDLTENEVDHLFYGICDEIPKLDREEVSDWKYIKTEKLKKELEENPEDFTEWFKILFPKVIHILNFDRRDVGDKMFQ